ncbi:HAAS signaling domain-containing protein [Evansella cellulosilytica]|uniref:Putative integral inner membrane protein n=1 Tax=Evansella cellulosilytica (strain ATCC 21833 / DSM 2522 / FERM P-1141 / JCM 9156 / N-4) TaxID=649639 RepID=E6TQQ2_EVAC2|nr:integral inner membrane protein [Evansella cellulosilytica]ADU30563.1 putative integral inner membrane protein [Evansella cellulosilytica DSM 2522]
MIRSKQEYISILRKKLRRYRHSEEIVAEIEVHVHEMLLEFTEGHKMSEADAMKKVIEKLGSPKEIAAMYHEELGVTESKTQWTFITVNLLFFIVGISLTAIYHLVSYSFATHIWSILTSIPFIIIVLYMFFWGLLGYEIGKEFAYKGKRLLKKTLYISLIPNLILMALVIFRIIPLGWFDPLLTGPFIILCIICTALVFPISYAGYRWGVMRSV